MATYPFVQSATDLGRAVGPRRAVTWHMAEGGGTVGYLAKPNPNGVSVHFVIERSGRIVQMLDLTHMQSSLRTSDIRTSDDADHFYGRTHALAVMGTWADIKSGTRGPNHASIGVEMEGYAAIGPNDAQVVAMATLYHDLVTRWPAIRSLAHRDFQDYKPCPGRQIPWAVVGGHGAAPPAEEDMRGIIVGPDRVLAHVAAGTPYFEAPDGAQVGTTGAMQVEWLGSPTLPDGHTRDGSWCLIVGLTADLARVPGVSRYVKRSAVQDPEPWPPAAGDCTRYTDAMKAAGQTLAEALP
jgi:hypothetical protein